MYRGMSQASHLVETVMINVADFAENFLTCGTCLCGYDAGEHTPKLLPCSHTVCKTCLERILETSTVLSPFTFHQQPQHNNLSSASATPTTTATFRCPICREGIAIPPHGGASSFPPAFIVNQLLDLLSRQRRNLVPKCAQHPTQELLYCETCDLVFCSRCGYSPPLTTTAAVVAQYNNNATNMTNNDSLSSTIMDMESSSSSSSGTIFASQNNSTTSTNTTINNNNNNTASTSAIPCCSAQHNVVTFNVALKRCNEILLHKASLCLEQLNEAQDSVCREIQRLDSNTSHCVYVMNECFESIITSVRQKQQVALNRISNESASKKKALSEQLNRIENERNLIQSNCDELNQVIDVRKISKGISHLNEKLDQLASLTEPRVNAFLRYQPPDNVQSFYQCLDTISGHLLTSDTYPPLSRLYFLHMDEMCAREFEDNNTLDLVMRFNAEMILLTFNNYGKPRQTGGDTIHVELQPISSSSSNDASTSSSSHFPSSSSSIGKVICRLEPGWRESQLSIQGGSGGPAAFALNIQDNADGTYRINIQGREPGNYRFSVRILDRPIRHYLCNDNLLYQQPLAFWSRQQSPIIRVLAAQRKPIWCCRESIDGHQLCQPFGITSAASAAIDNSMTQLLHVLDTGNSRVVTLKTGDGHSSYQSLCQEAFFGQASTGIAYPINLDLSSTEITVPTMVWLSNWRRKQLCLLDLERDEIIKRIPCKNLLEPSSICFIPSFVSGHNLDLILIVDNGTRCIYIVDPSSTDSTVSPLMTLSPSWGMVNGITYWPQQSTSHPQIMGILLATSQALLFCKLNLTRNEVESDLSRHVVISSGHFGGVATYGCDYLLATRTDKNGSAVRVFYRPNLFQLPSGQLSEVDYYDVDTIHCGSQDGIRSMRRLAGLLAISQTEAIVADVGGHCVSRLRYA